MPNPLASIFQSNSFAAQYQTEEWRQFSRTIKASRGKFCECCRRADVTLHAHHAFYEPGKKLWEYDQADMVVLCEGCHKGLHEELKKFRKFVFTKMTPAAARTVNGALAVALDQYDSLVFAHALAEFVSTPSMVQRYADAWNVDAQTGKDTPPKTKLGAIEFEAMKKAAQ